MRHAVALLRDISRGSLIVETATKDFRDAWHANQTYMSSVIRCMHRKKFVVVVVVEIALILTALSIGTLRVIQRSKNLSHLG